MIYHLLQKKVKPLLLIFLILPLFVSANSIDYLTADYSSIVQKGKTQNKFFFVKFSANWCATCKLMNTNVNNNPTLINFVEENFLAVEANVENSVGKEWQDRFSVCCLPTLIVFSPDGYEIARKQDGITSSQFLNLLENAINKKATLVLKNSPSPSSPKPSIASSISPSKPRFVNHNISNIKVKEYKWTILIGKYTQLKDANIQIKKLKNQLPNDAVLLAVKKENNKIVYHVTIGNSSDENQAIMLRKKLISKNINSTLLRE